MKIIYFTRYSKVGASSRLRSFQYLSEFKNKGVDVKVNCLFSDKYLFDLYNRSSSIGEVVKGYLRRLFVLFSVKRFDVVVIEKELFPYLPAIAEWLLRFLRVTYIVDYDDALFHRYDCHPRRLIRVLLGQKIDKVMRWSGCVIAGNQYLANRARIAGAQNIEIIPTVVDTDRYSPQSFFLEEKEIIVGWIGTPQTSRYLMPLLPVFEEISREFQIRFVAVGANEVDFTDSVVETWEWSEASEVADIQKFSIGIMPLHDSPWERGKCGYKLIQYMACSIPVVASPVGVNIELVTEDLNGYLASSLDDWRKSLTKLIRDRNLRRNFGANGRRLIEEKFSLKVQQERLWSTLIRHSKL